MSRAAPLAFIKSGSFSHINRAVETQLRRVFANRELHVIEIRDFITRAPLAAVRGAIGALRHDGVLRTLRRQDPWDSIIQTPFMCRWLQRKIAREIRRLGCEFSFQTQSMWDSSAEGIPNFIYTDHTHLVNFTYPAFNPSDMYGEWWTAIEGRICRNAAGVFTMSEHVTRSLVADYGVNGSRVTCVYAGSNSSVARTSAAGKLPVDPLRPLILFVGIDWERKGGPVLIEAFRKVRERIPSARLRIVGCNPQVDIEGCEVVGRLPLEAMAAHYAAASVFCLPTRIEPFGIAFVEAMRHGLPIVGTNLGAIPDMIHNGGNGRLIPIGSPVATAEALIEILQNPAEAEVMGRKSRQIAIERYTWDAVGDRIREAVESTLATR